jgi:uncharacterized protein (TIGR03083 family)
VADVLAGLDENQWEGPSLCTEWRVRDVAAHVALTPQSPGIPGIPFDRVNHHLAVAHAQRSPAALVAELRSLADSMRKPAITTLDNLLFDTLVHVQDVAFPLGLVLPMPLQAARAGAERVWRMGWPFWARRQLRGVRLTATDVDWAGGDGAGVRGPVQALLVVLTGRSAAVLPQLSGPGVDRVPGTASGQRRPRRGAGQPERT